MTLAYSLGAKFVKCPICTALTDVSDNSIKLENLPSNSNNIYLKQLPNNNLQMQSNINSNQQFSNYNNQTMLNNLQNNSIQTFNQLTIFCANCKIQLGYNTGV